MDNWVAITSLLFHVGLLIGAFVYRKTHFVVWHFILLSQILPCLLILLNGPGIIAERFLYIGLGFCIVLADDFVQIYQRYAKLP
ncbi:MAG: hypothetical protein IPN94_25640 [Sphingobacteriales bacterium]|nr:hypothetical protein [Sphingobacteriales bacterium]